MSVRIETNGDIHVDHGETRMEDVTVYATTRAEAQAISTARYIMGSVLYIVREGTVFMLDDDGAAGVWRSMSDGTALDEGGVV